MKIVMCAHHYPPDNTAGVELITERAARWLVERGHSVEVICVGTIDSGVHSEVHTAEQDGVVVHRIGLKLWGQNLHLGLRYRDETVGRWFDNYLEHARPDVVHSQSSYLLTASALEVAKNRGVPVVVSLNDYWFFCPRITFLRSDGTVCQDPVTPATCTRCLMGEQRRYKVIDSLAKRLGITGKSAWPLDRRLLALIEDRREYLDRVLRSVDRIVTPGPLNHDLLVARGFPAEKIRTVRSGLDLGRWRHQSRRPRPGGIRIGYLGQLAPHKGVGVLVEAFQQLRPRTDPPELMIYGDSRSFPGYVAEIEKAAAGNRHIRFLGRYNNRQVSEILAFIDVVVVPSLWYEVSPLVIKEAFAAGVPVVVSRLRNLEYQIQDGVDGLLFSPGDASDLACQLQSLIDQPGLLARLTAGVRPPFTLDEEMIAIEEIYRGVVNSTMLVNGASVQVGDCS